MKKSRLSTVQYIKQLPTLIKQVAVYANGRLNVRVEPTLHPILLVPLGKRKGATAGAQHNNTVEIGESGFGSSRI